MRAAMAYNSQAVEGPVVVEPASDLGVDGPVERERGTSSEPLICALIVPMACDWLCVASRAPPFAGSDTRPSAAISDA